MKKVLFLLMLLSATTVFAQDVIVKKDGTTILSKVIEIGTSEVKYKRFSNQNGPTYNVSKSDILTINYENGEKEDYSSAEKTNSQDNSINNGTQTYVKKVADSNNSELISRYNQDYSPTEKLSKKSGTAKQYMLIFWASPTSIMSNEEVEVTLVRHDYLIDFGNYGPFAGIGGGAWEHVNYTINIRNKTNKTIYVDKGNCFRIENDGTSYCYYENPNLVTINQGRSNGASLGLGSVAGALGIGGVAGQIAGGVSVGGGKSHSVSTTYSQQRVIAIAPHANRDLTEERIVKINEKGSKLQMVEKAETFDFELLNSSQVHYPGTTIFLGDDNPPKFRLNRGVVQKGKVLTYDENNSPYTREYILTYSTDEYFSTYSTVSQKWFLREIIGAGKYHWTSGNANRRINNAKYIEGLNKYTIEGYYDSEL